MQKKHAPLNGAGLPAAQRRRSTTNPQTTNPQTTNPQTALPLSAINGNHTGHRIDHLEQLASHCIMNSRPAVPYTAVRA